MRGTNDNRLFRNTGRSMVYKARTTLIVFQNGFHYDHSLKLRHWVISELSTERKWQKTDHSFQKGLLSIERLRRKKDMSWKKCISLIASLFFLLFMLVNTECYASSNAVASLDHVPEAYEGLYSIPQLEKANERFLEEIRGFGYDIESALLVYQVRELYLKSGYESWTFSSLYWFPDQQKYIDFQGDVYINNGKIVIDGFFPERFDTGTFTKYIGKLLERARMTQSWEAKYGPSISWDCYKKFQFFDAYAILPFDWGFIKSFDDTEFNHWKWGNPQLCSFSYNDAKAGVNQAIIDYYGFSLDNQENIVEDAQLFFYNNNPDIYQWVFRYWIQVEKENEAYWTVLCGLSTSIEPILTDDSLEPVYQYIPHNTFDLFFSVNPDYINFLLQRD